MTTTKPAGPIGGARRKAGKSFDAIARDLEALLAVDGFTVTYGTIRRWCIRLGVEAAS